jgi:hypothetical protein
MTEKIGHLGSEIIRHPKPAGNGIVGWLAVYEKPPAASLGRIFYRHDIISPLRRQDRINE